MIRYYVQTPALIIRRAGPSRTWADLPPLEGHARMSDALEQGYALTGRWRIVEVEGRTATPVMDSREREIVR